jgi:hypothetical protein
MLRGDAAIGPCVDLRTAPGCPKSGAAGDGADEAERAPRRETLLRRTGETATHDGYPA